MIDRPLPARLALPGLATVSWVVVVSVATTGQGWWLLPCFLLAMTTTLIFATMTTERQLYAPAFVKGAATNGAVALTFDDGPDPEHTLAIASALEAADARGTFFVVGQRVAQHPKVVRALVERGHQVANHSHAHRWWETLFWLPWAERDLLRASDAIADASGVRPAWFRPPIGMITPELYVAAERHGMVLGAWSVRPYDGRVRDPAEIERRLTGAVEAGDVVLLHDAAGPDGSAPPALAALPGVLADLQRRGLRAVTLAELAGTPAYRTHGERVARPFPRISVFVFCTMMALWWGIATQYPG